MIRAATLSDAAALTPLMADLGYPATAAQVAERLAPFIAADQAPVVWEEDGALLGVLVWTLAPSLHRPGPAAGISALVVAEAARGRGVGRALVAEAEIRCRAAGGWRMEVTSNMRREDAHRFYEAIGYERTSFKFVKGL